MTAFVEGVTELLSFFVTIALLQNIVLTTGFGSTVMMNVVRKPRTLLPVSLLMAIYSALTVVIAYPIDALLGTETTNYWRPLVLIGIIALLYIASYLLLRRFAPALFEKVGRLLPTAAFNNLVVGIGLVSNVRFSATISGNIGLAVGASLAFALITFLTAEGIERLDNPDMPAAFRGMPATLVYLGIVALALMGFTSDFSLI